MDPGAPKVHILYNGSTHYDALVRLESTLGWEPAWPQTGRPRYFKETTAARPVAASGPSPREIQEQNLIGDSLFGVETGDSLRERVIDVAGRGLSQFRPVCVVVFTCERGKRAC